jgi:two-component system, NarL family, nitrate/nitrite response regulator NarL
MTSRVQVVVVGRTRFYRDGIALFLEQSEGIEVMGTAATANAALPLIAGEAPIVLLEVAEPNDAEQIRVIRWSAPTARVIALGLPEIERNVLAYAEHGIVGFVGRDRSLEELLHTTLAAARGELECTPSIAASLIRHVAVLADERRRTPPGVPLTARELEIVTLIERGLSNKEIARQLHIELPTVKNHVHHILEKLDVSRRADAAALLRTGMLAAEY